MCGRKGDAENLNEKKKLTKRKTLEYVRVGQKFQLINTMRKWGDGHPHQKIQNILLIQKNEIWESFRKVKKKERTSLPWMGWFRYAGRVEILYVHRPFTTCKEGQIGWWIKLQNVYAIKEITEKQVLRWDYKQTHKNISFILILWLTTKK